MSDVSLAERIEISADPAEFYKLTLDKGWGDGAPLLPPTSERVEALLAACPYKHDDVIGTLAPRFGAATAELVAINAAMAGVEPAAFGHVIAAIKGISDPAWNGHGLTRTTSSVAPMLIVNGPSRDRLHIDYQAGCMGGAAGRGSMTIGRAIMLCLRNIGGMKAGDTTRSVFGQPARFGLCFGEWEERSPWPSLAERRGFTSSADVVTVHGGKGVFPVADLFNDDPADLLYMLAKSLAYPMNQAFLGGYQEVIIAINPIWAERLSTRYPTVGSFQEAFEDQCWHPIENFQKANQDELRKLGRVSTDGKVQVFDQKGMIQPIVCGGLGNLHAVFLTAFGTTQMQSREVERV